MFLSDMNYMVQQEHYQDLLREAEYRRLTLIAEQQQPRTTNLLRALLNWLGKIELGNGSSRHPHTMQFRSDHYPSMKHLKSEKQEQVNI